MGTGTRKAIWRQRLFAAGVVAVLHVAFFAVIVSDWAKHRRPAVADTVLLTLERPLRPTPPRPPPPGEPPKPTPPSAVATAAPTPLAARPAAPVTGEAPAPLAAGPGGLSPSERAGGTLNLGCLTPNLPKRLRDECEKVRYVAALETPPKLAKQIGPRRPPDPNAPKPPTPGWHFGLPLGVVYVYGPNDKHFLPGFGDTKTTVFEPEKVDFLPTPMK